MDAIFMPSAAEKSVSPNYKQFKNIPWRTNSCGANFISNPNENLAHRSFIHGGGDLLFVPPLSYHPLLNPLMYQINYQQQQQQPPLLPLPVPNKQHLHNSVPYRTRSLSSSQSNVKNNRNKDQSLTPKRSKPKKLQMKPITEATKTQAVNKPLVMTSAKALGPHPNDTPKIPQDLSTSIFMLSPPPSSLPLPSFSLRPKLSCKAQAASVDNGAATHNLRRFMRLP